MLYGILYMSSREGAPLEAKRQAKNFSKKFEKPLDKSLKVWYNNNVKGRERTALPKTTKFIL